ncbi:hypothetical protein ANN_28293 [Periplaneta americana]|uniref:Uncharacterized protein n=1 Tax=Periplaneta americana TaxID=6978 RepID=A0ABQ8TLJ7_PERAM|nr:hypothetical protein ANN_28293 [Periplaneta americana]
MNISSPKHRVVKSATARRKQSVSVKYIVRRSNGEIIPVCDASFQGICSLSMDRLSCLANKFHVTGKLPDDKRGGGRSGEKYKELTLAVKNNISLYKCRESYYSREKSRRGYLPSNLTIWLYNLCIVIHSQEQRKEDVHFYTWLETESSRGCNQVASALQTFLSEVESNQQKDSPKIIHLFSYSCPSQNKNSVMMATLIPFLEQNKHFNKTVHYFPIRGHSYMAPDRVFGRLEKCYRKMETILFPKQYHDVLKQHGTVKILNEDWQVRLFKSRSQMVIRSKLPFKMTNQCIITYKKISEDSHCISKQYILWGQDRGRSAEEETRYLQNRERISSDAKEHGKQGKEKRCLQSPEIF